METMLSIAAVLAGSGCAFAGVAMLIAVIWVSRDNR